MEWIFYIGAILVVLGVAAIVLYKVFTTPIAELLDDVREWLVYAVAKTEKELGSGTGELKLRAVYDKFLEKFPKLASKVNFQVFSSLVDEALEALDVLMQKGAISVYIKGDE